MVSEHIDEYFDSFPAKIKKIFLDEGFIPEDYLEADAFIKSLFKVGEVDSFDVSVKIRDTTDNKLKPQILKITKSNFYQGFYAPIWNNLNLSEKLNVALWTFNFCKKRLGIVNKSILFFPYDEDGWKDGGYSAFNDSKIFINIKSVLDSGNALWISNIIAHELTHAKQDKAKLKLEKIKGERLKELDDYNMSSHITITTIATYKILKKLENYTKKVYKDRFDKIKDNNEWDSFCFYNYLSHPGEVGAYNYGARFSKTIAIENSKFFPECREEKLSRQIIDEYIQSNCAANWEKRHGYKMSPEDRANLGKIHNLLELEMKHLALLRIKEYNLKTDIEKINELNQCREGMKLINSKIEQCMEILMDLFFHKEMPKNLPVGIFDSLYDKNLSDEISKFPF